jgi:cell wall assembly regulator SMI1
VDETNPWDEVADLVGRVRRDPKAPPQRGATADELRDLERRLGSALPQSLVRWLLILNGDTIGEGGVMGARPDAPELDIVRVASIFRDEWTEHSWLPVASDGTGNFYVLLEDGRVGFVDTAAAPPAHAEVKAESLPSFLLWYLPRT